MTRAERIRSGERVTNDLLPACPRCHDLNDRDAQVCATCGTHLYEQKILRERLSGRRRSRAEAAHGSISAGAAEPEEAAPPAEPTWNCGNCLREWDEPYCQECGANLMRREARV